MKDFLIFLLQMIVPIYITTVALTYICIRYYIVVKKEVEKDDLNAAFQIMWIPFFNVVSSLIVMCQLTMEKSKKKRKKLLFDKEAFKQRLFNLETTESDGKEMYRKKQKEIV